MITVDLDQGRVRRLFAIGRPLGLPFRPYLHARISRITVVEQLPQIIIIIKIEIRRPNGVLDPELQSLSPFGSVCFVS